MPLHHRLHEHRFRRVIRRRLRDKTDAAPRVANPPFRVRKLESVTPRPVHLPQDDDCRSYRAHLGEHELVLRTVACRARHDGVLVLLHDVVSVSLGERLRLLPLLVYRRLVLTMRREALVGYGEVIVVLLELFAHRSVAIAYSASSSSSSEYPNV